MAYQFHLPNTRIACRNHRSGKSRRRDMEQRPTRPKLPQKGHNHWRLLTICSRTVLWKICSRMSGTSSSSSSPISMIRSIVNGAWARGDIGMLLLTVLGYFVGSVAQIFIRAFSGSSCRKHTHAGNKTHTRQKSE